MKNHYLSLILLSFVSLAAMEQGVLVPQKPVLKTVPSLKDLAGKAYAKYLHDNAPKEALSDTEMVEWCELVGLQKFFDYNLGIDIRKLVGPQCKSTKLPCPKVFSSDGKRALVSNDWLDTKQSIIHADSQGVDSTLPVPFFVSGYGVDCRDVPVISPNGEWVVGWKEWPKNKNSACLMLMCCMPMNANSTGNTPVVFTESFEAPYKIDYTFYADTIILRVASSIYKAPIAEFVEKKKKALTEIYQRNDRLEYPNPLHCRTMYALSDHSVACIGPDEKSIEMLGYGADGKLSLINIISIPDIFAGMLVVHTNRGIAALDCSDKIIRLYQLLGDDAGEKATIQVEMLETYVFSPSGNCLACGTNNVRQVVEVFDCTDLTFPKCTFIIPAAVAFGPAIPIAWTEQELFVADGYGKKHTITFNNAAPLIKAYADYREKQKEENATSKNPS